MKKLELKAPAKLNIGLNVLSKRPDGYHNIQTVFFPIALYDIIKIMSSDKFLFSCSNSDITVSSENTVIKAVSLLEEFVNKKISVKIDLVKNIPIGAGMGGGSSDGAAVLYALNSFFNFKLESKDLSNLALKIGSDVPFFLKPVSSFAESRGEKLMPINLEIPYPILIINPGIHISTKWAYDNIIPNVNVPAIKDILNKGKIELDAAKNLVTNDFEKIVFKNYPEIREIKEHLYRSGARFALMTGSGSTVFGIFENIRSAKVAQRNLKPNYFTFINE